jgi:hypothetical protein
MTCGMLSCEITSYVESLFKSSILRGVDMTCGLLSCEITSCCSLLSCEMLSCLVSCYLARKRAMRSSGVPSYEM